MKREDAEEYTQALGQVIGGSWRQIALANRLGVPRALGMKLDEWVRVRLGGYARLSITEKREAVLELTREGESRETIAATLGVGTATVSRARAVSNDTPEGQDDNDSMDIEDEAVSNDTPILDAIPSALKTRSENEKTRKADLFQIVTPTLAPGLYLGDFRELSKHIEDESVQLVFTDPPYDAESIRLYDDAAKVAARILRKGGSFIAYTGQRHLPQVLSECSRHLRYWWTIAGVHSGGNQILQKLGIRCGWKPLVWFVKDTRGDVQNVLLDVVSGAREKDDHEWQQAEEEALYYIEKLTTPDGLVVDFFIGSGTTAAAASKLGRRWIGFEIDEPSAEKASERLSEAAE